MSTFLRPLLPAICSIALTVAAHPPWCHAQDFESITRDDVARAWKERGQRIRSGRFSLTVQRWSAKGAITGGYGGYGGPAVPPQDTTFTFNNTFIFDGEKLRYETDGTQWDSTAKQLLPRQEITVWDGETCTHLQALQSGPTGTLTPWVPADKVLDPLRFTFRALDPRWNSIELEKFVLKPAGETIDGEPCLLLETAPEHQRTKSLRTWVMRKDTYWISPGQDFCIRRHALSEDGRESRPIDIEYQRDPQHGWYPSRWTSTDHNPQGKPLRSIDVQVADYALNASIEPDAFQLELPDGTRLTDIRGDRPYETYLVRDGTMHLITPEERRQAGSYEAALDLKLEESRWPAWLLWAGGVVVAVVVGLAAKRHVAR